MRAGKVAHRSQFLQVLILLLLLDSLCPFGIITIMKTKDDLIQQLDSFELPVRHQALTELLEQYGNTLPEPGSNVNMHYHSFFSYNAEGYSPSRIAWEARQAGLYGAGLCDFDVLDGQEEFLAAGEAIGLRVTANLETRAFVKEFAAADINSPGEPGVSYFMGAGFAKPLPETGPLAEGLAGYRSSARQRNEALIERINVQIPDMALDYEADVLPLTPAGVATERHIISAYRTKATDVFDDTETLVDFWAHVLGKDARQVTDLVTDIPAFEEQIRSRLAKRGGLGYEQPSDSTFPAVDAFIDWIRACDAIPMAAWLDGTSEGESDPRALLECLVAKGTAAINIIPDRNWRFSDPDVSALKIAKLNEMVEVSNAMNLPINIGTEMNKLGLPFVDDLTVEALAPHKETFLTGARIMVGHTILCRYANFPYLGEAAQAELPDVAARNRIFERVGGMPPLTIETATRLRDLGPELAFAWLMDEMEKH